MQIASATENSFIAALDTKGHLYTWGSNNQGELGHGDYEAKSLPQ